MHERTASGFPNLEAHSLLASLMQAARTAGLGCASAMPVEIYAPASVAAKIRRIACVSPLSVACTYLLAREAHHVAGMIAQFNRAGHGGGGGGGGRGGGGRGGGAGGLGIPPLFFRKELCWRTVLILTADAGHYYKTPVGPPPV